MATSRRLTALRAVGLCVALTAMLAVAGPASAQVNNDVEFETLTTSTQDPTALEVAPDGRVIFVERTGRVKIWSQDGSLVTAGRIGVDSKAGQCNDCPGNMLDEGGLHGVLLAKDFMQTGHLYVYYSVPNSMGVPTITPQMPKARGPQKIEGKFRLSRFTLVGNTLDMASEQIILENPAEWLHCCHYGGDMEWLADGTMLVSVGDDTISSQSNGGYSPRDYRSGREWNNADLTSQNLADRRGKLLRIDPEDVNGDGSLIPPDNPFLSNPEADPHVYAYGFRSDYRFEVDPLTQKALVTTVGPDALFPHPSYGPQAHEEIEIVPKGGGTNHGWPRCIANNIPYNDYNYETGQAGPPLSCQGMTPAAFYYSYYPTYTNPWVQTGGGGDCIIAAAVYRYQGDGALKLPARFLNTFLFMDWSRDGMWSLPIDSNGNLDTLPSSLSVIRPPNVSGMASPIDGTIGPDGAVYLAEYGSALYNGTNAKIVRMKCAGCRPTSADYQGSLVVDPEARPFSAAASVSAPAGVGGPAAIAAAGVLAVIVGLRRRRKVIG
jgi:glucose/arabinose dehydrogenase